MPKKLKYLKDIKQTYVKSGKMMIGIECEKGTVLDCSKLSQAKIDALLSTGDFEEVKGTQKSKVTSEERSEQ